MERIRSCLIGCGRIAINHVEAVFQNRREIELVAICDLIPEKMEQVLAISSCPEKEKSNIRRYTDYTDMLSIEKPMLVSIATESGSHAAIAMDALQSGSHVIVEKPIALSLKDADSMIIAAKAHGLLLCVCHQNRFNKPVRMIRKALDEGRFGRLLHAASQVRWSRDFDYYAQAPWRGTWMQDGGALMNQCIHSIDLLRWMMGDDVQEVMAYTDRLNHPYIETEDLGLAIMKFGNGSYGQFEGTTNVYPKNLEETFAIFGERGTVKAGGLSINTINVWRFADQRGDESEIIIKCMENPPNVYGFGHTLLYADMVMAIKNGRAPYVDGEAGRRAVELELAMYKSTREGKPVRLPLLCSSTMDMAGSFKLIWSR